MHAEGIRGPEDPMLCALRESVARELEPLQAPHGWPRRDSAGLETTLARAELELLGVHHVELARVLARAVRWLERRPTRAFVVAFQQRASRTIAAARASGAWVPSVAERLQGDPVDWPHPHFLARAAFELDPRAEHAELRLRHPAPHREA